jgi:biotin carboxylase
MKTSTAIIQIGHSRDGRRYYVEPAHQLDLKIIVIEGPDGKAIFERGELLQEPAYDEVIFTESSEPDCILEKIAALSQHYTIDTIIPGFELYTLTSRIATERFCPHRAYNSPEVIERFRFKSLQRQYLRDSGANVLQPNFAVTKNANDVSRYANQIGYPVILKADDSGGGFGVVQAFSGEDCETKLKGLLDITLDNGLSGNGVILVEEPITGDEISLQGIVDKNGKVDLLGMSRKLIVNGETGDRFMESQHLLCSIEDIDQPIRDFADQVIQSLGLRASAFHIDARYNTNGQPVLIETGARLSGANIPRLLKMATGLDWGESALAVWRGETPDTQTQHRRFAGLRFITPTCAQSAKGYQFNLNCDELFPDTTVRMTVFNSERPGGYQHIADRVGFVEVSGTSPTAVEKLLESVSRDFRMLSRAA